MFFQRCIAPHFLQLVKLAGFGSHDVYHNVDIIDQHPLKVLLTLMTISQLTCLFLHLFFYGIGDGPDLWLVVGFANNEEVGDGFGDFTQVKRDDVFSFFILDSPDDGFVDF